MIKKFLNTDFGVWISILLMLILAHVGIKKWGWLAVAPLVVVVLGFVLLAIRKPHKGNIVADDQVVKQKELEK